MARPTIITKREKKFILGCVKQGMGKLETLKAFQVEFQIPISVHTIIKIVYDEGLHFYPKKILNLDSVFVMPNITIVVKKLIKENQHSGYHDILIRDKLIEDFGKNIPLDQIRYFCAVKNLQIKTIISSRPKSSNYLDVDYDEVSDYNGIE
jgi:hypothetical protein